MKHATTSISLIFSLLFTIALFIGSVLTLVVELQPFTSNLTSPLKRFVYLEDKAGIPALSIHAQKILLNECLEAIAGPTGSAQPSVRRTSMLTNCQSFSEKIVDSIPTFSLAWYIAAFASIELRQNELFNFQLAAAQKTAPNEQWLAELRVSLAEDNLGILSAEARIGNDSDLKLLAQSRIGVASIASRYVDQIEFRERITNIVETLSEAEQEKFVRYVQAAASQRVGVR